MFEKLIKLDPSTINFTTSATLLNRSKRFVLPIPALPGGGEELEYPDGPKKGEPIYTNKDGSIQRGIVFANQTDSGWQGVQGNGKEAIIINDLNSDQAMKLLRRVQKFSSDITKLTSSHIQAILSYARDTLKLTDMFDKDLESIRTEMRPVDHYRDIPALEDTKKFLGYWEVSKETEHKAVLINTAFSFDGPVLQQYPKGAVVMNDGNHIWCVDKGVVKRNWVLKNWAGNEQRLTSPEADIPPFDIRSKKV